MQGKITPNKPVLIVLYGFPGSGKSAFAKQFAEEIGAMHLHADKVAVDLFGGNNHEQQQQFVQYMAHELLRAGVSVVYDGPAARSAERRTLRATADSAKAATVLVWLQIDPDTAFARTQNRDRRKSEDKYAQEYTQNSFEDALAYQQNPDGEQYVVISGKHTFHTQSAAVLKKLYELGIVSSIQASQANLVKPELVNLVPQKLGGRVDMSRRNISIR